MINQKLIYLPCFAMMILTATVMMRMFLLRVTAVKKGDLDVRYFKTYNAGSPPHLMLQADRNFINLLEVPTLFYMVCGFFLITQNVDTTALCLAWAYVGLRCLHSMIHLTTNKIGPRMSTYTLSWVVLLSMGLILAFKVI